MNAAMKHYKRLLVAVFVFLGSNACKKDDGIGLDVLPGDAGINVITVDSIGILSTLKLNEKIVTDQNPAPFLGNINDAYFGNTSVNFITQIRLPNENLSFGNNIEIDTAYLALNIAAYYGKLVPLDFKVYELKNDLKNRGQNLASDRPEKGDEIGNLTGFEIDPSNIDTSDFPGLIIPLNKDFIQALLGKNIYGSVSTFIENFKGLIVEPSANLNADEGYFALFNPTNILSRMVVVYRSSATNNESTTLQFPINDEAIYYNEVKRNFAGTAFEQVLQNPSLTSQSIPFASVSGSSVVLEFPHLQRFFEKNGPMVINQAIVRMSLTKDSFEDQFFPPFNKLYPAINGQNTFIMTPDFAEGSAFLNGNRQQQTFDINVTRFVQWQANGKLPPNTALNVSTGGGLEVNDSLNVTSLTTALLSSVLPAPRSIFTGTAKSEENRIKLIISYTPIQLD